MVSVGPYHRGKESLHFMEEQKWYFLRDFLEKNCSVGIEVYIQKIRALEERARRCYSENIDMGSDEFVLMLLLDGCFLLEHSLRSSKLRSSAYCNLGWAMSNLETDLLLLENQIPFFVIHNLFYINGGMALNCEGYNCPSNCPLLHLLFKTRICSGLNKTKKWQPEVSCNDIHHYLQLLYMCMVPNYKKEKRNLASKTLVTAKSVHHNHDSYSDPYGGMMSAPPYRSYTRIHANKSDHTRVTSEQTTHCVMPRDTYHDVIPCASRLHEAGVTFKRKEDPSDRYDISFNNGTLEIPLLSLSYYRKVMWANIAAFEQTPVKHACGETTFVSYLALMDALIDTQEDVALLEQSGILSNMLPSEQDAADFFNDLGKLFVAEKYTGHDLFKKIRKYSDSNWHRQRAKLMHNYFSNPWSAVSVVAAGILLILSILQTFYSSKGH